MYAISVECQDIYLRFPLITQLHESARLNHPQELGLYSVDRKSRK